MGPSISGYLNCIRVLLYWVAPMEQNNLFLVFYKTVAQMGHYKANVVLLQVVP
jgi:hypothetical protein